MFLNSVHSFYLPMFCVQIYSLYFYRDGSLSLDEVYEFFQIRKGSASQGLRGQRRLGAVSLAFALFDRLLHFVAEIRLHELESGFLCERINLHLEKGLECLNIIENWLGDTITKDSISRGSSLHEISLDQLSQYSRLLPWIKTIAGKSCCLPPINKD